MADNPNAHDLQVFRSWMHVKHQGGSPLHGADRRSWDKQFLEDLVALSPPQTADVFTRLLVEKIGPAARQMLATLGRRIKGKSQEATPEVGFKERGDGTSRDPNSGIYKYRLTRVDFILDVVVTVVASMFPVLSIIVLFFIRPDARLGLIAAFTTLFALALATMTQSGRQEIFAACAA